jgi:uncharacterized protein (TIGR00251 family)
MNVPPCFQSNESGTFLHLRIQPRASRDEIVGLHGDALKVRIAAPPVDSAANEALIKFLAKQLNLPKSRLQLTKGQTSRNKTILITKTQINDLPKEFMERCGSNSK